MDPTMRDENTQRRARLMIPLLLVVASIICARFSPIYGSDASPVSADLKAIPLHETRGTRQICEAPPATDHTPTHLLLLVVAIAPTLLLFVAWNATLRRRVAQRTSELTREIERSKRQTEELLLSEERFQAIYNSVSEAILIRDLETGEILDVNQTMCEMFGYSREEALCLRFGEVSSGIPPYTEREAGRLFTIAQQGGAQRLEWQTRDKSGRVFWIEISLRRARIDQKDVLLVTIRDISDRKKGEQALRQSEEKYREIFQNSPIAIFQSTREGRFLSVNPALAAMFGYPSPAEMVASVTNIPEQLFVHPEQRSELLRAVLAASVFVRREVDYRRIDGTNIVANLYMRAVRDHEGAILFLEGFVEDITDRKLAYELTRTLNQELEQRVHERTVELEQANAALQHEVEVRHQAQMEISCLNDGLLRQRSALETANRELESFSFSISHDLRAPLRNICAFANLLIDHFGAALEDKALLYLQKIITSCTKMQELIDGLLSLSRISLGDLNTVSLDLAVYVREIAQELQQAEPQREVTFIIADSAPGRADPILIRSVLENLLRNAWKYTSKREKAVIEFGCERRQEVPTFYVRDNGAGFEMAYADKLFGVFQRMHAAAEFEGIGIGLATVQRIIHRHGGRIWAEAEVDKGATFYFTLQSQSPTPGL
jgi:PAS domain S-box-containing protein